MLITHLKAQKRLQKLSDENGYEGIECRVCGKKIIPPDFIGNHIADDPDTYHYVNNGGREFFIHVKCLREAKI